MNFSVAEGHVACAVECQGVQTDEVTESVVDCSKHKDECMFKYIEPASCRLESVICSFLGKGHFVISRQYVEFPYQRSKLLSQCAALSWPVMPFQPLQPT